MYKILFLALSLQFSVLQGQEPELINAEELITILNEPVDQLHIINFWATWCGPCVSEIPIFEKLAGRYPEDSVKFLLVSLDFPSQVNSSLVPFLEDNEIKLPVVVMKDLDYNKWIPKVDKDWKGNLPATLIFNNSRDQRSFVSGALEEDELVELVNENLN